MERIEALLRDAGEQVAYAAVAGARARPEHAYDRARIQATGADGLLMPITDEDKLFLVECDYPRRGPPDLRVNIAHHRPGDTGWGVPPEEFLPGSSIGQVVSWLARHGALPQVWERGQPLIHGPGPGAMWCDQRLWRVSEHSGTGFYRPAIIPHDLALAAAADHCLGAAYHGQCPGVHPDNLMRWRVQTRAAFQRRPTDEILADIERAREVLRSAPRLCLACGAQQKATASDCPHGDTWVADLRRRHVPELLEAAAREGITFVGQPLSGRNRRQQIVLQNAGPEHLAAWPAWAAAEGLVDLYGGDPARGFAGGYQDPTTPGGS
jgi:hypothetical protein